MIDINFFMKFHQLKKRMISGKEIPDSGTLFDLLESFRRPNPVIYNIETTNACNMRCQMCPRTTMMTRKIETIDQKTFESIADQITPFSTEEWSEWKKFCLKEYGIHDGDMSENHFFLYIIPKIIQLHGYGAPLLDKMMAERINILTKKGFFTYFSCNPSNIDNEKNIEFFENGLSYIKYSIESVDDEEHKKIRGRESNFTESYEKILQLVKEKEKRGLQTVIVITMLDLNREKQVEDYRKLEDAFKGVNVYLYLKSQDQQWYQTENHGTNSIHWSEICQHPWMSMTIKSNAEVAMCMEDFNNEIILGDSRTEKLYDIWNGEKYHQFRKDHFSLNPEVKCAKECDMKLIGNYLNQASK
jgi:wyosine [tRNA(Phe)-imidazoG37] synthetase (radical SAM superfamily)